MNQTTTTLGRDTRNPIDSVVQMPKAEADCNECPTVMEHLKLYCRKNPETAAMWCFGLGFVIGWKLKPW